MNSGALPQARRIGVLGGTFDPVHIGHLRLAIEVLESLALDEVRMIVSARPPHRDGPSASAEHRLAMLRCAVESDSGLVVDDRECLRDGASYTVDTLESLRDELGFDAEIFLLLGSDAFMQLESWHRWRRIPELARLAVIVRPGYAEEEFAEAITGVLRGLLSPNQGEARAEIVEVPPLQVSATRVRALLAAGGSVRHLLPQAVLDYIFAHDLYQIPKTVSPKGVAH